MKNNPLIPEYGPLYGMRVMLTGSALAGPWSARMLGDYGAEVIKIEQPGVGDAARIIGPRHPSGILPKYDSLNRNMMGMEFNMNFDVSPESKRVFVDLCKQCDVWINNVPNIDKHGATDALAMEANPRLIICHTTGFGLPQNGGDPEYLGKACVDTVGQAFSGLASLNGMPDGPFIAANPIMSDLITAAIGTIGILVAYTNMLRTGKGQVIDNSMFEATAYAQHYTWAMVLNGGGPVKRSGELSSVYYPFGYYQCGDSEWVSVGVYGPAMWKRFITLMGSNDEEYTYKDTGIIATQKPENRAAVDKLWYDFIGSHTVEQVEKLFAEHRIPCSRVLTAESAYTHPHYISRNDFITLKDHYNDTEIIDLAAAPKFCGTPIDASRYEAAPLLGEHTDIILKQLLAYDDDTVEALKKAGSVAASRSLM